MLLNIPKPNHIYVMQLSERAHVKWIITCLLIAYVTVAMYVHYICTSLDNILLTSKIVSFKSNTASTYTNRTASVDSVRHAYPRYLIESKHMLNQTIPNHDSSHKTGMPTWFECWHGFQTSPMLVYRGFPRS